MDLSLLAPITRYGARTTESLYEYCQSKTTPQPEPSRPAGYACPAPRRGKVARLPYATREQINQLIEDGFPYKAIIEKLTQDGLLPYPVSERNLSSWRLGGHQEWHWEQQKKQLTAQLRAAALRKLAAILD